MVLVACRSVGEAEDPASPGAGAETAAGRGEVAEGEVPGGILHYEEGV